MDNFTAYFTGGYTAYTLLIIYSWGIFVALRVTVVMLYILPAPLANCGERGKTQIRYAHCSLLHHVRCKALLMIR